jgi:leucyl aminopeptidase (aminopeptidase T)
MSHPGFSVVLDRCLGVQAGEEVLLIVDDGTDAEVVAWLREGVERRKALLHLIRIPTPSLPGEEPPPTAASDLLAADAAIELTSLFIGSSKARQEATRAGVRYLAMPGVVLDTFRPGGPLDMDFDGLRSTARLVGDAWSGGSSFRLTSAAGTDLSGSITGRHGRVLDGIARDAGGYMAPPDVEAGTAPVEGSTSGVVVVDADLLFMGTGPLPEPVVLYFRNGELTAVEGGERDRLVDMIDRCADPRMSNLAEVSMGLNPAGSICAVPMETESALGTAHIALGNSIAYGGTIDARAHLDCVMAEATLEIDGDVVISNGSFV